MKGRLLLVPCLLLLLCCLSCARLSQPEPKASSGSPVHNLRTGLNYTSIQDAINADETLDGQTILVDDGTYHEHVVVNKPLTLIGENRDNTIVDGNGTGPAFTLNANNVSLINFTATNAGLRSQMPVAVFLNHTANCVIENMETSNSSLIGIDLENSTENEISGSEILGNQQRLINGVFKPSCGIFLVYSNENTISNNAVSRNDYGIYLGGSNNNLLINNHISSNGLFGLGIFGLNNNVISNQIWNTMYGLLLDTANCSFVNGNNISNSTEYGIWLNGVAENNTISDNTIQNNTLGIRGTESIDNLPPQYNLFYHNNIVQNAVQSLMPPSSLNSWDDGYPSGGNYWSDYNGTDLFGDIYQNASGSDGIGDSAYNDSMYNVIDRYPLMGMFSDFTATSQRHVQTISNSTISNFQFNGTAMSFDVAGENNATGFCRICIPIVLINGTCRLIINGTGAPYTLLPESNSIQDLLYFTYHHSTQEVIITLENPSFPILPTLILTILLTVIQSIILYTRALVAVLLAFAAISIFIWCWPIVKTISIGSLTRSKLIHRDETFLLSSSCSLTAGVTRNIELRSGQTFLGNYTLNYGPQFYFFMNVIMTGPESNIDKIRVWLTKSVGKLVPLWL